MAIASSFSENKKDDDRPRRLGYADPYAAISPPRQALDDEVGITKTSAYLCLCRHRHKHSLRHSFAVRSLIDAYRDDGDVHALLPLLATYLGHADPSASYWYLTGTPELMALVGHRLETVFEADREDRS